MRVCPICDGEIKREEKKVTYRYKEHTRDIVQSGEYCTQCHEGFLSPKDLKISQKSISDFRREIDNLLTTDENGEVNSNYFKKLNLNGIVRKL
jgi:YgiT-type zinc finger domain-containing protein